MWDERRLLLLFPRRKRIIFRWKKPHFFWDLRLINPHYSLPRVYFAFLLSLALTEGINDGDWSVKAHSGGHKLSVRPA